MNIAIASTTPSLADIHTAAITRSNAWRGQCLHIFARAETAVTEALATLATLPDRSMSVRLPHLVGQRFEALADVMELDGAFAADAAIIRPLVMELKEQMRLRAALAHGVGQVTVDRMGRWTMILRVTGLKAGQLCHDVSIVEEREGEAIRNELHHAMQRLCCRIGKLQVDLAR